MATVQISPDVQALLAADMIRRCREVGLSEPVFSLTVGFRITLERPKPQPSSSETTEETKEETEVGHQAQGVSSAARGKPALNQDQILAKLSADPESMATITAGQFADPPTQTCQPGSSGAPAAGDRLTTQQGPQAVASIAPRFRAPRFRVGRLLSPD